MAETYRFSSSSAQQNFAPCVHAENRDSQDAAGKACLAYYFRACMLAILPPEPFAHRMAPQRERFDTHNLRKGFSEVKTGSRGASAIVPSAKGLARALPHARSPRRFRCGQDIFAGVLRHARFPHRVRRGQDTSAWRHGESTSRRTISAKGRVSRAPNEPTQKQAEKKSLHVSLGN